MTNLEKKLQDLKNFMNNNDYYNAISTINDIRNIPGRPAELSDSSLKSLQAFLYYKKGDLESAFDLIKSAFNDSGGGDNKINKELQNFSIALFNKIFTNFDSNKNFAELSKAQYYINEIKNLYNKPNELNTELPKIEFRLKYEEFNFYMNHNDFNNGLNKINEMKNINSNVRPNEFNDAHLINLEAFILSEKLKDYTKAFDSLYKALKYYKNNDNEKFEDYQGRLIDSGINIHKKYIIDKKFQKAKESYDKVTEIITDDKMLNKYKIGCLLNNWNLNRWEEAYELIESLNIEYLDEEEKIILNKQKVIIISNIISEYLKNGNLDNSENYIKKLYDLAPSVAFNLEIKLIKKKLWEQFENHEYERIISFIDEKLNNLDKIKYAEFYSYLEQFKQDVQKANMQKIYSEGKIDDYLNQIAKNGENQSQEKQEIYNLASEIFNNEAEKDIENGNLKEAEEKIKKGIEK